MTGFVARTSQLPQPGGRVAAPPHPLTHHEILGMIEPFARRGLRVDLDRSDRLNRCLVFRTIVHDGEAPPLTGITEDLRLDNPASGIYRLTRSLTLPDGTQARLLNDGAVPGELLAYVESVPFSQHFRVQARRLIARNYCLAPAASDGAGNVATARLLLTQAAARIDGLTLTLTDATVPGYPADLELMAQDNAVFDLPEDLLAVLGRGWGLLHRYRGGWRARLDAPGAGAARSRALEAMLERTVAHLDATLAEPPARFHETRRGARWGVALKRGGPLIVYVALLFAVAGISRVKLADTAAVRHVLWFSLTVLTVGALTMRNRPRLEFPKLPRRLSTAAWQAHEK